MQSLESSDKCLSILISRLAIAVYQTKQVYMHIT